MKFIKKIACSAIVLLASVTHAQNMLTIHTDKPGSDISPAMWGIFFEDINFAADGGLYAEMVKNRSFEFSHPMMGWKELKKDGGDGRLLILNNGSINPANPRYAGITVNALKGAYTLSNEGFRGMGVKEGMQYNFSVIARKNSGNPRLSINLVAEDGKQLGTGVIENIPAKWTKLKLSFMATGTNAKAHLDLAFEGSGSVDMDMISLFPNNTWKNRPEGLRADLVQMLADLKPGFIRFPGGCIVEGKDMENRYQWKKTVGPVEDRKLIMNRWNVEFNAPRNAPDYYQSYGLGFYEYFQLAEDIGAAPLPILSCGMACQFNTGEVVPLDQLDPYIQDALDLIEFANGSATSKFGKLRAAMGHPKPFNLKMLGVGNEQWGEQYIERYRVFAKILKAKYPEIALVSGAGPFPNGSGFDYLWKELKKSNADLVDEHYYKEPAWFFKNATRYDNYDRKGPRVFAGEFAAHSKEDKTAESRNTWISALAEAAFMTGLERNADVVRMASYAPLLAHVDAWQWRPDLIWFDNLRVAGTPNYYVQKMFSTNTGNVVVPALQDGKILAGTDSIYASAVLDKTTRQAIIKMVNISSSAVPYTIHLQGKKTNGNGTMQTLSSAEQLSYNSLTEPRKIHPTEKKMDGSGDKLQIMLEPMSVNVIKLPVQF